MVWRRNPLGPKAGLQFSVEKFDEILHKNNIYDLSKEGRIFVTAIAEELVSELYRLSGNQAKSNNHKRIKIEELESVVKSFKSDIFSEVQNEFEATKKVYITMETWTGIKLKQIHPALSKEGLVSSYMDYLIGVYCEKLSNLDLKNLANSVTNLFGKDWGLCQSILEAGNKAVELYKKYN